MKRQLAALGLSLLLILMWFSPVNAATQEELESQKSEAAEKKAEAEFQIDMTQTTIEGIDAEIERAEAEIQNINTQISGLDAQIAGLETDIQNKNTNLAELQNKLALQADSLKERLRVMYMFGNDSYLDVLFSSKNFADLIARLDMVKTIAQADRNAVNELEKTSNAVETEKKAIEATKTDIENLRKEQENSLNRQQSIKNQEQELLAQNQEVLKQWENERNEQQAIYDQADQELAQIALEKEQAAQDQIAQNRPDSGNSGSSSDGSGSVAPAPSQGLIWPISSAYHPVAWDDMFGDRIHPVYGTWTWHSGCDMAAPAGTPVWSPGDGVVTFAGWNGGYGNCIMIAVDGGTVLFGHLSAIYVTEGQYVSQGTTVGAVGTTGTSTGNHLHLSFLVGGEYVDPLNYMHW